jgi:SAM-dependent methyltransferase
MAQAGLLQRQGRSSDAEQVCNQIVAREPGHVHALNLLGLIFQSAGRHRSALKALGKALASDPFNAACHYNLAVSQQALGRSEQAADHFRKAITFGRRQNNTEKLILQNPFISACIARVEATWPIIQKRDALFDAASWDGIVADLFLRTALETVPLRGIALERFLTLLRAALLDLACAALNEGRKITGEVTALCAAMAQQCFINEYVFAFAADETRKSEHLTALLQEKLAAAVDVPALLLAAVSCYRPLHAVSGAQGLLKQKNSGVIGDLVRQQLREPLEESEDRSAIPALTAIGDGASADVMRQYEENPYPRWTVDMLVAAAADHAQTAAGDDAGEGMDILIAGCGTGQHAVEVARQFPHAQLLAIDVSRASLAYARRKTREAGLRNIDYAQADILRLGALGRSFDRIESVGVLHHLADPEAGWRLLLSLLRPHGVMRIGLYSETARQPMTSARAFIAERGYRPTPEDIRKCRQDILRDYEIRGWMRVIETADFYSMSGCRDLLFNVVEHRFTIPRIADFLQAENLVFEGFDLAPETVGRFQEQFQEAGALTDLGKWQSFEAANPQTFRYMYVFTARKI